MELDQAKKWFSEICTRASQSSKQQGSTKYLPNSQVREATLVYERDRAAGVISQDFSTWWNEVSSTARSGGEDSIKDRYIQYLTRHDWAPPDEVLNELWGSANGTLNSLRSKLKKLGWGFENENGGYRVTQRPRVEAVPPAPPPLPVAETPHPTNGISPATGAILPLLEQIGTVGDEAAHDLLRALLEQERKQTELLTELKPYLAHMAKTWGMPDQQNN